MTTQIKELEKRSALHDEGDMDALRTPFIANSWRKIRLMWEDVCWLFNLLPDALKFGSVLLVKSLAVSIVLGLLSTPATAVYATRLGIRVPIEGVPYVNFTIGLWSFIGFALSIIMVTYAVVVLIYLKIATKNAAIAMRDVVTLFRVENNSYINKAIEFLDVIDVASRRINKIFYYLVEKTFVYLAFSIFLFVTLFYVSSAFGVWGTYQLGKREFYLAVLLGYLASLVVFALWYDQTERSLWMLQGYLTFPLLVVMAISLFASDTYGSLLRIIRFGGGIETQIRLSEAQYKGSDEINGYLLMRSDTSIFVLAAVGKSVIEIPAANVSLLITNYDANWKLPDFTLFQQRNYIHID